MDLKAIKEQITKAIEDNRQTIISVAEEILKNPETGFCEEKTSALVRKVFDEFEIAYEYPYAVTAVKAKLKGRKSNYNICIIGELDAVKCNGHKFASPSGAAHACGHNAQIASMLGAAIGIKKSGIMNELDGDITFFAVPAEEFIEIELRNKLKEEGKISYHGGKQQLIFEGAFDDIDMAMMIHAQPNEPEAKVYTRGNNLGFLAKTITFKGKAAHGSKPYEGTNALNAAALALLGIHSNRETFTEADKIRIHPIITKGGDVVNSVPDEVCIDTYVRGATFEAIKKGDDAVERSVFGAASMIGAKVEIENMPGYLPLIEDPTLSDVFESNAKDILGSENIVNGMEITGSTDIGDLSQIMPVIQPSMGGFTGNLHGTDFTVSSDEYAYILPAKIMATTAADLLFADGEKAKQVLQNFKPKMNKKQYISYLKGE